MTFSRKRAITTAIIPPTNARAIILLGSGFFLSSRSQNKSHASVGSAPPKNAKKRDVKKCESKFLITFYRPRLYHYKVF